MTETQAVSHRDCDLGKWLYANGMKKDGAVAEMKTLGSGKRTLEHKLVMRLDDARNRSR